ncbi:MAG: hypothetical protein VW405_01925 [Rhodospirillaceae bacterium]
MTDPTPPEGYKTWLDAALNQGSTWGWDAHTHAQHLARAELKALREDLEKAQIHEATMSGEVLAMEQLLEEKRNLLEALGERVGDGSLNADSGLWDQLVRERDAARRAVEAETPREARLRARLRDAADALERIDSAAGVDRSRGPGGPAEHSGFYVREVARAVLARIREEVGE